MPLNFNGNRNRRANDQGNARPVREPWLRTLVVQLSRGADRLIARLESPPPGAEHHALSARSAMLVREGSASHAPTVHQQPRHPLSAVTLLAIDDLTMDINMAALDALAALQNHPSRPKPDHAGFRSLVRRFARLVADHRTLTSEARGTGEATCQPASARSEPVWAGGMEARLRELARRLEATPRADRNTA
ncbi:MAG: hypothetical protein WEB93_03645 [Sphingomonadales bacterium]